MFPSLLYTASTGSFELCADTVPLTPGTIGLWHVCSVQLKGAEKDNKAGITWHEKGNGGFWSSVQYVSTQIHQNSAFGGYWALILLTMWFLLPYLLLFLLYLSSGFIWGREIGKAMTASLSPRSSLLSISSLAALLSIKEISSYL